MTVVTGPFQTRFRAVKAAVIDTDTTPDPPTNVTASDGQNGFSVLTWDAPLDDGGSPITSYEVTSSPGAIVESVATPANGMTFIFLTNGTTYAFTVKSVNAIGKSVASAPSNAITPVAPVVTTVPGAPRNVTAAVASATSATINWTAPSTDGGATITAYKVTASTGQTKTSLGAGLSTTITGLTSGSPVTFTVQAINSVGTGSASAPSNSITPGGFGANTYVVPNRTTGFAADDKIDLSGVADSTFGFQRWLGSLPAPVNATDWQTIIFPAGVRLRVNGTIAPTRDYQIWRSADLNNKARIFADVSYPFRPQPNPSTNPNGDVAKPWMDINNDQDNPSRYGWDGRCTSDSPAVGGHPAGLGVLHRTNGVFKTGQIGAAVEIWYMTQGATGFGNWHNPPQVFTITGLSGDKKAAYLDGTVHSSWVPDATVPGGPRPDQDRFWAIAPRGDWQRVFTPTGKVVASTTGNNANGTAVERAQGPGGVQVSLRPDTIIDMKAHDNCILRGIEVEGPNSGWQNNVQNRGQFDPCENENQNMVDIAGYANEVDNCDIHHGWGTLVPMNGTYPWVHDSKLHHAGRQAIAHGLVWGPITERNKIHSTHHSLIDIEPNSDNFGPDNHGYAHAPVAPIDWVLIKNNGFGLATGGAGQASIAGSSAHAFAHIDINGNHSLQADVDAGDIPAIAPVNQASQFGPKTLNISAPAAVSVPTTQHAGYVIVRNHRIGTMMGASGTEPAFYHPRFLTWFWLQNCERTAARSGSGFLEADSCVQIRSEGNKTNGVLDTKQYETGTTPDGLWLPLGSTSSTDWWVKAGAPEPAHPRRP
jgi:hypothetical protein